MSPIDPGREHLESATDVAATSQSHRRAPLVCAVVVASLLGAAIVAGQTAAHAAPAVDRTTAVGRTAVNSAAPDARRRSSRLGRFETGNFREFDAWEAANGSLTVTDRRSYEGKRSAKSTNYASGNQFQRVWYGVRWREASDVWYGMALHIPRLLDWCWWTPMRWDNFLTYGSAGDIGGVRIYDGKLYLDRGDYTRQTALIGPVVIPQARWFWIEVHQRFSETAGRALSELYIDGVKRGRSTAANSAGRVINHIRYGNVAMATQCSRRSSIYFDRVWVSNHRLGPRGQRRRR
jgi:hypothetical protein